MVLSLGRVLSYRRVPPETTVLEGRNTSDGPGSFYHTIAVFGGEYGKVWCFKIDEYWSSQRGMKKSNH